MPDRLDCSHRCSQIENFLDASPLRHYSVTLYGEAMNATTAAVDATIAAMLDITEQGKLIRRDLRREFPGIKFSVRRGTGTSSLWLSVSWEDGPAEASVRQVVRRYRDLSGDYSGETLISRHISRAARAAAEAAYPGYDETNFEHYAAVTQLLSVKDAS